mmetsp:Transcript_36621/g.91814  ORF Transcript_36621/g.91814 Transcript_36621/m.91814 type:complete len:303 (-) Transcript_36621:65-973(-)
MPAGVEKWVRVCTKLHPAVGEHKRARPLLAREDVTLQHRGRRALHRCGLSFLCVCQLHRQGVPQRGGGVAEDEARGRRQVVQHRHAVWADWDAKVGQRAGRRGGAHVRHQVVPKVDGLAQWGALQHVVQVQGRVGAVGDDARHARGNPAVHHVDLRAPCERFVQQRLRFLEGVCWDGLGGGHRRGRAFHVHPNHSARAARDMDGLVGVQPASRQHGQAAHVQVAVRVAIHGHDAVLRHGPVHLQRVAQAVRPQVKYFVILLCCSFPARFLLQPPQASAGGDGPCGHTQPWDHTRSQLRVKRH